VAAAWNELPATGGLNECAALVRSAEALRVSVPELSVQLARRALLVGAMEASSTTATEGEARGLSMRARAVLTAGLVRISQHPSAVEPGFTALELAESGGATDVAAEIRLDLASCAQEVGEPLLGGALLRPVLERGQVPPSVRAVALGRLVGCVAHVARRDDVEDALAEADRLLAVDDGLSPDARRLERARLAVRSAAYHRWYGDNEDAVTAARDGLNLLSRLRRELRSESDRLRAQLVLELVCALLDEGEVHEAENAASPTVDEPVRATSAAAAGQLMLAMATRVHLPAGQVDRGRGLLDQAAWIAERHKLDSVLADAMTEISRLDEQAGRPADALTAMRVARAAENRRMRSVSRAARHVLVGVGTAHGARDVSQQSVAALMRQLAHPAGVPVAVAPPPEAPTSRSALPPQREPRDVPPAAAELAGTVDVDKGTGLLDREGLFRRLRSVRKGERPVALTLVRFEPNKDDEQDRGPDTGIMAGLADKVRDIAPENAELARSDGGELAVLLPHTTRDQAEEFAATLRERAMESDWLAGPSGKDMSISTGVVQADHPTTDDDRVDAAGMLTAARDALTPAHGTTSAASLADTAAALKSALAEETPTSPKPPRSALTEDTPTIPLNARQAAEALPVGRSILSSLSIPTGSGGRRRAQGAGEQPPGEKTRWPSEPTEAPRWTRAERRAQEHRAHEQPWPTPPATSTPPTAQVPSAPPTAAAAPMATATATDTPAAIGNQAGADNQAGPGNPPVVGDQAGIGNPAVVGDQAGIGNPAVVGDQAGIGNPAVVGDQAGIGNPAVVGNQAGPGNPAGVGNQAETESTAVSGNPTAAGNSTGSGSLAAAESRTSFSNPAGAGDPTVAGDVAGSGNPAGTGSPASGSPVSPGTPTVGGNPSGTGNPGSPGDSAVVGNPTAPDTPTPAEAPAAFLRSGWPAEPDISQPLRRMAKDLASADEPRGKRAATPDKPSFSETRHGEATAGIPKTALPEPRHGRRAASPEAGTSHAAPDPAGEPAPAGGAEKPKHQGPAEEPPGHAHADEQAHRAPADDLPQPVSAQERVRQQLAEELARRSSIEELLRPASEGELARRGPGQEPGRPGPAEEPVRPGALPSFEEEPSTPGAAHRSSYEETKAELARLMAALNANRPREGSGGEPVPADDVSEARNGVTPQQSIPTPPEPEDIPAPPELPRFPEPDEPEAIPPVPPEPGPITPAEPGVDTRSRLMAAFDALTAPIPRGDTSERFTFDTLASVREEQSSAAGSAKHDAVERGGDQAAGSAGHDAVERGADQAAESAGHHAAERAREQSAERVQEESAQQVQEQAPPDGSADRPATPQEPAEKSSFRVAFEDAPALPSRKPATSWAQIQSAAVVESPADQLFGQAADTPRPSFRSSLGAAFAEFGGEDEGTGPTGGRTDHNNHDAGEKSVTEPVKETTYDVPLGPEREPAGMPRRGERSSATIASLLTEALAAYQSSTSDDASHRAPERFDSFLADDGEREQSGASGRHRSPE
jgi:GGDEF domain-containing protein